MPPLRPRFLRQCVCMYVCMYVYIYIYIYIYMCVCVCVRTHAYIRLVSFIFCSFLNIYSEPDTIPEEELNKEVHVKSVDLHKGDNCERHHTDLFECTENAEFNGKQPHGELVVRRGEEFLVTIELDRPYDKQLHDLNIVFKTGELILITLIAGPYPDQNPRGGRQYFFYKHICDYFLQQKLFFFKI